jgi:hypothetical protein
MYMYIYIKERKEKERGREKVLLRNQTTIAQVIAKPGAWLLNHLLELEKAAYAIFFCSTNVKKKKPFFSSLSIRCLFKVIKYLYHIIFIRFYTV